MHAVGHVREETLSIRAFVSHPQVLKEIHHTRLYHRGKMLFAHVLLSEEDEQVVTIKGIEIMLCQMQGIYIMSDD